MVRGKQLTPFILAISVAIPGIYLRLAHVHLEPPLQALVSGAAIMGAAFLLLWACDAAQKDISQALALAVVAFIAVLPEYAVDIYFTWQAGKMPESDYANYAVANMTGANRLLIGVAWTLIVAISYIRSRRPVVLEKERRTELFFLGLATAYAFVVVIKHSLTWIDGVVFLGIYVWYMLIAAKRPCEECHIEGPGEVIASLPKSPRRKVTLITLAFAAGAILANAEPFCEGLIGTGKAFHINEFLLVQWLAPIASEMPEFVVAIMFALRGQGGLALGSLVSAKLNQWTLLVGMIPGVYALSSGAFNPPIPFNDFQIGEIHLTAAQSLLAVVMLAAMRLSPRHALILFTMFTAQLISPQVVGALPGGVLFGMNGNQIHMFFSHIYLALAVFLIIRRPGRLIDLRHGLRVAQEPNALIAHESDYNNTSIHKQ